MGLEEVKSDILQEAEEEADRIKKEAEEEKEEIIEEAEEKADKIREKYQEELEEEKESYRKRTISNARMKAKQEKLKAKQENLEEAFEQFRDSLEDLTDSERESYVESCLDRVDFEVGKVIGGEEFESAVDVDFEEKDINGIIAVSDDGKKRQDFTFGKILEDYRENYRKEVSEKLF